MSIGYACILLGVPDYKLKSVTLKNASSERLNELIFHNLNVLNNIIDYNIENDIKLFRISSDIIPLGSHPANKVKWWVEYKDLLSKIGLKIKDAGMRVSMHPGQYTILNSLDDTVVDRSIEDLIYHACFLDALNVDASNKIILHIGGVYGDKQQAITRFFNNYCNLPDNIKSRLVIENDEKNYTINEVLNLGKALSIPVVFDYLHHQINQPSFLLSPEKWIVLCKGTWQSKDGKQKIHYSQQAAGRKLGSHSQTIRIGEFMNFYYALENKDLDIMLEVKDKNLSAIKCIHSTMKKVPVQLLEKEWAKYKYLVLSHSQKSYSEIREMLKNKGLSSPISFYEEIERSLEIPPTKNTELNAAQHIWGYFKKKADITEKTRFKKLLYNYEAGASDIKHLKNFLLKLTQKYKDPYLKNSYYFLPNAFHE